MVGVAEILKPLKPHLILHAGDIGANEVLEPFEAIAPTLAVRGNIDRCRAAPDLRLFEIRGPESNCLRVLLTHIAVQRPRLRRDAAMHGIWQRITSAPKRNASAELSTDTPS